MIIQLYVIFVIPLVLSMLITPLVIRFARRVGAMDQPNQRKIHQYPIPRLGGIAIYASFFLSLLLFFYLDPALHPFTAMAPQIAVMLVVSLTIVLLLGIWDDMRALSAFSKLAGQCVAAAIVYLAGFRISVITHPFDLSLLHLGLLDFPATVLWIVAITNAFNLIDGLDGLASGVAFIVSLTTCLISFLKGDLATAMLALILAGSVLGFLRYNFNGARIFLGDSGSLFLGFLLAILSMTSSTKGSTAFSLLVPVLALGLPIMETVLSMIRRFLGSILPDQPEPKSLSGKLFSMFIPDAGHIHHRLLAQGLSHRTAVLLLYIVSCVFGIGALAVTLTNNVTATAILIAIGVATFVGVRQLRYKEMAVLRNGVLLPLYERPMLNSTFFQGFLDLAFIALAFTASHFFVYRSREVLFDTTFLQRLAIVCGIQLTIFHLSGLYKGTFRQLGIGDILRIVKSTTLSSIVSWTVIAFLPWPLNAVNATHIVLNFYLLLSLVLGTRFSFHVLDYLSRSKNVDGKKKVIIYGTGASGIMILQQLLQDRELHLAPLGFLDDDPRLEGKRLNGYPVFGGHWKLARLARTTEIEELIISGDSVKPRVFARLVETARSMGISVRRFSLSFEEVQRAPRQREKEPEKSLVFAAK